MKFIIILLVIALLILLYPYFRILIKRILLSSRIRKQCRQKGYKFKALHVLPFWGRNNGKSFDFCIETKSKLVYVKLLASKYKKSVLKCPTSSSRQYYFTNSLWLFSKWSQASMSYDTKLQTLPNYDVPSAKNKQQLSILLIHPICFEIVGICSEGQKRILAAGDTIYGMRLESGKTVMEYIHTIDTVSSK